MIARIIAREQLLTKLAVYMKFEHEYADIYDDPDEHIKKIMLKAYCDAKRYLDEELYILAKRFVKEYEDNPILTDKEIAENAVDA